MEIIYPPFNANELESLIERLHPPGISVDNDTCEDCTLIKVDSANKHGILLDMVQVLTDLDLVISKSYISSDGGWFMDVFHVTNQVGNKLTDESLILYIKQALCATRREVLSNALSEDINVYLGREVRPGQADTALELTGADRPGLMSEISAVLVELGCNITAVEAWTHCARVACIVHIEDGPGGGPILDQARLARVRDQLGTVVEARHGTGDKRSVRLAAPGPGRTPTERRLHQLMYEDGDYERCRRCNGGGVAPHKRGCDRTHVTVERCREKGYWVVTVQSRDRPKLLFDTVCALTDLEYEVFHAVVASKGNMAEQEYFLRPKYGCNLDTERERSKLVLCLIAAVERRISHGMRLDLQCGNQMGLLSDITRVLREFGLSMSRLEIATRGKQAFGTIYVTDTSGVDVDPNVVQQAINEIGGSAVSVHKSPDWLASSSPPTMLPGPPAGQSFGGLLWSQFERISGSFSR